MSWSSRCCICLNTTLTISTTSVESSVAHLLVNIPHNFSDLAFVFSATKAACLPPHCPWDCAIVLLPGASPPQSRIYPLSEVKTWTTEDYVAEVLQQGLIKRSTSPASAEFFFIEKKDGGLRPCINYHELNAVTVKYTHPSSLVCPPWWWPH